MQKYQYLATFPAGCYGIIVKALKGFSVDELTIIGHDDSSVTFSSPFRIEKLIELRFFTNIYFIVESLATLPESVLKGEYFRLMSLKDGAPQALDMAKRSSIENSIIKSLRLTANTHLSLNDFYLISRSDGSEFLGLRLSRARFKRESLQTGELRPELAHILCLAAGVKAKDSILDMFAGYGSIPLEAFRGFGCKQIIAADTQVLATRHENKHIKWYTADACNLDFIPNSSVHRIVTDPPWGIYDEKDERSLELLYAGFTAEMMRTLRPGGIAIVLTNWPSAEEHLTKNFKLVAKWNVLVSGKKATIFKLQK